LEENKRALCGRPRADFHVTEDQLGGFEDTPVARVRAPLILFRDEGAVDVEEAPPGMNRIGPGLQVGGVGLGQRPRGGDLPVFAAVGRQNGQQVRYELMITGHGVLHGSFPLARRNQTHSLTYSTAEQWAQRCNGPFCAIRENTLATTLVFVSVRAYIALSFNDQHSKRCFAGAKGACVLRKAAT
jgi:hypothetical protein